MIGRVVITTVPRGLDGGTGIQPVLRTQGLRPAIAERLAMRAAYPHPFPFGDPRNPRVLFHRIEAVGDRTVHMLGSVRDAGGSYTGRSNHLAELVAIDPAETRGLPGGPVFAASSFPWLTRWTGEPRELPLGEEPAVPGYDPADPEATGRPARCTAWEKATGDAGWAGELAQSFLDGRRALIWAGENVDVLQLFVEAARLLPASVRWQVTFNTCEIEPFPAHWRAVRPELGLVGNYEPENELRLVLAKFHENCSRSPNHDLARLARGETVVQKPQPTRSAGFAGDATRPSDEAALRARLREISEERQRRTNAGRSARYGSSGQGNRRWIGVSLLLGALSILGMALAIATTMSPEVIISLVFGREDKQVAVVPGENLRSAEVEKDREAERKADEKRKKTDADEEEKLKIKVEKAKKEKEAAAEKKRREAATAEKVRHEMEMARAEQSRQDQLTAQRQAIQQLEATRELEVSLIDESSTGSLEPDQSPKPVDLCCKFDLANLLEPTFELVSPYPDADRFKCTGETVSLASRRTWKVTGSRLDRYSEMRTEEVEAGRIIAEAGKLFLEPLVQPDHFLFARLQNSLLFASTCDPGSGGKPELRCIVRLSEPVALKKRQIGPFDNKNYDFDNKVASRIEGIPNDYLRWQIECTHPSWATPESLKSSCKTLAVALPPRNSGQVLIQYLDTDATAKAVVLREGKSFIDIQLEFLPQTLTVKVHSEVNDAELKDVPIFKNLCKIDWLRNVVADKRTADYLANIFKQELLGRLRSERHTDAVFNHFLENNDELINDERIKSLEAFLAMQARLESEKQAIKVPGQNYPNENGGGLKTYNDEGKYNEETKAWIGKMNDLMKLRETFLLEYTTRVCGDRDQDKKGEAELIADGFSKAIATAWASPITVEIKKLEAVAHDSKGNKYPIPIVKPEGD